MTNDASHRSQPAVTILNVDDNEAARYFKSRTLTAAGYRVVEAGTGKDALRQVHEARPQLVLLDVRLTDIDGLDVCQRLKADPNTRSMMVLLVSARAVRREDRIAGLEHGADGYLVEPFESEELLASVNALLRLHHSEQRLQLALNATREVVWDWDIPNDRHTWNQAGIEVFGWKDIVEQPQTVAWWMEKVHPEDRERVSNNFHRMLDDGVLTHWQDEYRFLKADHTYAWVSDRGNVIRDESGRALRMVGAMQDITARKQTERQLLDRNERLSLLARISQELLRAGSDETALQHILEHFSAALDFELFFHYRVGELPRTLHLVASGGLEPEQQAAFATIRFGQYLCGLVAERQAPLVASDLARSPYAEAAELCSAGVRCYVGVPLIAQDQLLGTMALATRTRDHIQEGELELIKTVCDQVGVQLARAQAERGLRDSEARLASEAVALARLNELSSRLWRTTSLREGLDEMLTATIELLGADMGNVQLLDADRGVLTIEAQNGFEQDFLDFFREVSATDDSACGRALRSCHRIIVEDVEIDGPFTSLRPIARLAGFRAVQSTPLVGRSGRPIGMLSTHWESPHRPSEQELRRLDLYVRQAADFIERLRIDSALRESEARYRDLIAIMPAAMYACDKDGRITLYNEQAARIWGRAPRLGEEEQKFCGAFKLFCPDGSPLPHDRMPIVDVLCHGREARNQAVIVERPDGTRSHVLANLSPIRNHQGEIIGAVNVFTDVTEIRQAAERLRLNEERLRLASESAGFGSYAFDPERQVSDWSSNLRTMFNLPQEGPVSLEQAVAFIHPDDRERMREEFEAAIEGRYPEGWEFEFRVVRPNGEVRWFVDSGRPLYEEQDAMRSLVRIVGVVQDMTERKEAEEVLRDSEDRFRTLASAAPVGIFRTDAAGNCIYVNEWWMQIADMTLEEARGMGWTSRLHPEDRDSVVTAWTQASRAHRSFTAEYRFVNLSGTVTWVLGHAVPEGEQGGYIGTTIDITERKWAEVERQKFVSLADQSLEFIGMCNRDFKPFYVNEAGRRLVGLDSLEQACAVRVQDYFFPEDQAMIMDEFFPRVLRQGHDEVIIRFRHFKTGEARWMIYNVFQIKDENGEVAGYATVSRDITERKQAEQQLAETAARLKTATDIVNLSTYTWDPATGALQWDARLKAMFGLPPDAHVDYDTWREALHPEDRERALAAVATAVDPAGDGIFDAEYRVRGIQDGVERWIAARGQTFFADGRPSSFVGTALDITARKQVEELIRRSEALAHERLDQLAQIYRYSPVGLFTFDREYRFLSINERMAAINGVSVEHHLGRSMYEIVPDLADKLRELFRPVLERGEPVLGLEIHGETPSAPGAKRDWLCSYFPLRSADGMVVGLIGAVLEVTARKQAEKALRESEERLRAAMQVGRMGSWDWNVCTGEVQWSEGHFELLGLEPGAVTPSYEAWASHVHRDDLVRVETVLREAMEKRNEYRADFRVLWSDGSVHWMAGRGQFHYDGDGRCIRMVGIMLDITERKEAEKALLVAAERAEIAQEAAGATLYEFWPSTGAVSRNATMQSILGYRPDEVEPTAAGWKALVHPDDVEAVFGQAERAMEREAGWSMEYRVRHKQGQYIWMFDRARIQRDAEGRVERIVGMVVDISERKRIEAALRDTEERLRLAVESADIGTWDLDLVTGANLWDRRCKDLFSIPPEEDVPYDRFLAMIHAEDRPRVERTIERAVDPSSDGSYNVEYRILALDGRERWIKAMGRAFFADRDGVRRAVRFVGTALDMTERHRFEQALRDSEERLRRVLETDAVGVLFFDGTGTLVQANEVFLKMTGYTREQVSSRKLTWRTMTPPEYVEASEAQMERFAQTGRIGPYEKEYFLADGSRRWMLFAGRDLGDGTIAEYCVDISDRKRAEEALRDSEARFKLMADSAPVLIWINGRNGAEFVNRAYLDFLGVRHQVDVTRYDWTAYLHPEDRDRYLSAYRQAFDKRARFDEQFRFRRHDGSYRWMRSVGQPRLSAGGELLGYVGATYDITEVREAQERLERWNVELEQAVNLKTAELHQSHERLRTLATELNLAEQRERKRLATELHDHLQQMLVVAKMKLAQGKRLAETLPACAKVITDSDNVLSEALTYTRTLVAELSPPVLRDHGLAAGLTWLGEYMNNHGLTVTVTVPEGSSLPLPEDQTVLLFQSVRELLINSSKHAGTGQALVTMNREDGLLRIVVSDQGKGFAAAAAAAADSSNAGVSSKFGLYSIRERMRALGGTFAIESTPGQGTTATLTLPLGAAEPAARARGQGHGASGMQELLAVSDQQSVKLPLAHGPSPLTTPHSPRSPIRVLLVDDHLMVRQGLRMLLEGYRDIELVGEAGDGEEAVALVDRLHPHLVLMDINMPKMNGIEATTRIKSRYPDVVVLGLTVNAGSDTEAAMRRAGAFSLLTKEAAVDQIYASIHKAIKL